ncbi:MAG: HEPN domain-containing protein [Candidatus Heimdallarchaeota archaeon]|nr:HEPN domain-containing protein [Candidatus Heimdallarchaeota archaeon]
MAFDPYQFYEIGSKLLDDQNYDIPGGYRTSVSRLYYASFLFVRKFIEQAGISIAQDHLQHEEIIVLLTEKYSHLGNQLRKLRDYRNDADYLLFSNISKATVRNCLKMAEQILTSDIDFTQ